MYIIGEKPFLKKTSKKESRNRVKGGLEVKKENKMLIGVLAVLLVTLPVMSFMAVNANDQELNESDNLLRTNIRLRIRHQRKQRLVWFFKGAEKFTITGTVTARDRNILILTDGNGDRFNIVLPGRWNVDTDVVSLNQIFEEYVSIDETVTLEVLKRTVTNENGVTVTTIFCYEITTNSNTLYAVLLVNIDG